MTAVKSTIVRSGGPRTAEGIARTRLNALKHGLASTYKRDPLLFQQTECIALAICGDQSAELFEQAIVIAEDYQFLHRINTQRMIAMEKLVGAFAASTRYDGENNKQNVDLDYQETIADLERFRRYQKRAWSRRHKAVRRFTTILAMQTDATSDNDGSL